MAEFGCALRNARSFYATSPEEFSGRLSPQDVTEEHARELLNPEAQADMIEYARQAAVHFAATARIIETEALPYLSDLKEALCTFVNEYSTRHRTMESRAKSWVPSLAQDLIWGRNDPTTWSASEVDALSEDIETGGGYLREILKLFDKLSTHFERLSKIKQADIDALGYSSLKDLRRLYVDRVACSRMLMNMYDLKSSSMKAFGLVRYSYPALDSIVPKPNVLSVYMESGRQA